MYQRKQQKTAGCYERAMRKMHAIMQFKHPKDLANMSRILDVICHHFHLEFELNMRDLFLIRKLPK